MRLTARSTLRVVAASVGDALKRGGIRAVLTGGACASLHTDGRYQSSDVDLILEGAVSQAMLDRAMSAVGFLRRGDRYVHPTARFFVEFPRGPLAIGGDDRVVPVLARAGRLEFLVLSPTDCCRDRLAAFYHWSDRGSLDVAVKVALRRTVDMEAIERWSRREGFADRFSEFRQAVRRGTGSSRRGSRPARPGGGGC